MYTHLLLDLDKLYLRATQPEGLILFKYIFIFLFYYKSLFFHSNPSKIIYVYLIFPINHDNFTNKCRFTDQTANSLHIYIYIYIYI